MRSDEECVDLVLREAARLDRRRRMRRSRLLAAGGGTLVAVNLLVVALALGMGGTTGSQGVALANQRLLASVFADGSWQAILVVSLAGVALGIILCVAAYRLRGSATASAEVIVHPSRNR